MLALAVLEGDIDLSCLLKLSHFVAMLYVLIKKSGAILVYYVTWWHSFLSSYYFGGLKVHYESISMIILPTLIYY